MGLSRIEVRRCTDLHAAAEFFLAEFQAELETCFPNKRITAELIGTSLLSIRLLEIVDVNQALVVGMAGMERDGSLHLEIIPAYRLRWAPHRSLDRILDFFFEEQSCLLAKVKTENTNIQGLLRKLGFQLLEVEQGMSRYRLTASHRHRTVSDASIGRGQ